MTHRARDVETLLPAPHQFARDFQRDTCAPVIAHFAGVVVIGAGAKTGMWMRIGTDGGGRRVECLGFRRHLVANRNGAGDGQTRTASIGEEIKRRLCAHFHLAHHVGKKLERRAGAGLSAKSKDRKNCNGAQKKNH